MKILTVLLLAALPAAAQAEGMHGGCQWQWAGGLTSGALYAALAALGYLVLQHAAKETAGFVRRTGIALGMALAVIGLLGVLCGVGSHIKRSMPRHCCTGGEMRMSGGMGDRMGDMPGMSENTAAPMKKKAR